MEDIFVYYSNDIELKPVDDATSRFIRNVRQSNVGLVPFGQIELSTTLHTEEALVHELLHLSMPLVHGIYTIGFDVDDQYLFEFSALTQNVLEHDMFVEKFISFGYSIDKFLGLPSLTINYNQRRREGSIDKVY